MLESDRARRIALYAALLLATLLAYEGLRHNGFIGTDDPQYVVQNRRVREGLSLDGIRWAFLSWQAANWHPLTWLSHMLDVQLFGMDAPGHHATSLGLHALNCVLVLRLFGTWTGRWGRSAIVAGLFALHPLHVEAVAWVAERKEVLSMSFCLLALAAYTSYARSPGALRMALVSALFALGLMAKPMLVTLPFALLLLDYWPLERMHSSPPVEPSAAQLERRGLGALVLEKLPLFALAFASCAMTLAAQHSGGAVASQQAVPMLARVCNALVAYLRYLVLMFWPAKLAAFYPYPNAPQLVAAFGNLALLGLVTWYAVRVRARRPYWIVGWLWYLGTLVPVIGIVQVGSQSMADRYTYLPLLGPFLALTWHVADALQGLRAPKWMGAALAVPMLACCVALTHAQVGLWSSTLTLYEHAVEVTEDNAFAQQSLSTGLIEAGRVEEAIAHLREALRLRPGFSYAHNSLGGALYAQGKLDEAIAHLRDAILLAPDSFEPRINLGLALTAQGKHEEAAQSFAEAVRIDPAHFDAQVHLARALGSTGKLRESLVPFAAALALEPGNIETRRLKAITHTLLDDVEPAVSEYQEILRLSPVDLDALNQVAWIRATHAQAEHRNGAEAVRLAQRAVELSAQPNAILYDTLAAAHAENAEFPEALAACDRAIELTGAQGDAQELERLQGHRKLFAEGRAFHAR
jgi:protein O-mannosyl-transferase